MLISVIIPSYKPGKYLWECLDSLIRQTLPKNEFEVVLVLNGCGEPWETQIQDYINAHKTHNFNFIQTDQPGVSNARNIALDMAKGEYVTFIDDDDYVSPMYLEELYAKVSPDTISLCYPYAFNDGNVEIQLPYAITDAYDYCLVHRCNTLSSKARKFFSGPCMKLIPMSFIQGRRFDVRFKNGEDSLFMFLISDKISRVSFTSPNAVYYRRYRTNSAVTTKRRRTQVISNCLDMIKVYNRIYFKSPWSYSFVFYLTRILGAVKICYRCIDVVRNMTSAPINGGGA